MTHTIHDVYQKSLLDLLAKWRKRRSRSLSPELSDAALILLNLDFDPIAPLLHSLYSNNPRGRTAYDPTVMLRALILMTLLHQTSIKSFVKELRSKPRLALIAGFEPHQTPSVGAFYLFIDRLEDGPFLPNCPHRVRPSVIRKKSLLRNLAQEKADKEQRRAAILAQSDSITLKLKDDLLTVQDQPRPHDFLSRLEDLLFKTAVIPSARRGLLGDPQRLALCGDGSALVSGAAPYGKPTCQCRDKRIFRCDHPRLYQDHCANWGWDSYRETFYFGHTFYQHIVNHGGHDLPVHILLGQASESDFTLSLTSLDRFSKTACENKLDLSISAAVYDSGHDGRGNYEYLLAKQINAVIVLNPRRGSSQTQARTINPDGVPICPAGLPMRRHSLSPSGYLIFNCPVKRPTHLEGKTVWKSHPDQCPHQVLCQPLTKMGPTVYIKTDSDPRLYPRIARDSPQFKELMKLRSGCERSNSAKKVTYHLERRPCRSATHYLFRLYLISIVEHAKAWLAEDRKLCGDDFDKLVELARVKAPTSP